jgi:hypothetical protein
MLCKHCILINSNHSFKITDFDKFKKEYLENPDMINTIDKNGFTFFQNILWSFSRERFSHSNKLLFIESKKALYFLLNTLENEKLRDILSLDSKKEQNFSVLHDYAKNLMSIKNMDWEFINKLKEHNLEDLLLKKDNYGMSVMDYFNVSTNLKKQIIHNQCDIKKYEKDIIQYLDVQKCEKCNGYINLLDSIKNYDFSKFKTNEIIKDKVKLIIELRSYIYNSYKSIQKDNDGHSYVILLWKDKLAEMD